MIHERVKWAALGSGLLSVVAVGLFAWVRSGVM